MEHLLVTDSPALPIPTLDHVVVNVRDRLPEAAGVWRRLGFTLTPMGRHTLGSINHLAMFGTDYLELVGVPPEGAPETDVMEWPEGLNGLVFGTDASNILYNTLKAAGAPVLPPLAFSRPVTLPDGAQQDASFRTVRVERDAFPAGRLYFCHHLTRHLVWRDTWRRHANGVLGIAAVIMDSNAPQRTATVFEALFGGHALRHLPDGVRLNMALTRLDVLIPPAATRRFAAAAPLADGRAERMTGLVFRVGDIAQTIAALKDGGVKYMSGAGWAGVAASEANGVALKFAEG